jgi:branched-chain amino acid transport system substrate-binding protein
MHEVLRSYAVKAAIISASLVVVTSLLAEDRKYDPGASDAEIRIGQTMPYSGPVSALSAIGKVQAAYFRMITSSAASMDARST